MAESVRVAEYTTRLFEEGYDYSLQRMSSKQSDGEVSVMMEVWGMQSTPSLQSLPGSLWPREVASDRVLPMGQIELKCVLKTELLEIGLF